MLLAAAFGFCSRTGPKRPAGSGLIITPARKRKPWHRSPEKRDLNRREERPQQTKEATPATEKHGVSLWDDQRTPLMRQPRTSNLARTVDAHTFTGDKMQSEGTVLPEDSGKEAQKSTKASTTYPVAGIVRGDTYSEMLYKHFANASLDHGSEWDMYFNDSAALTGSAKEMTQVSN